MARKKRKRSSVENLVMVPVNPQRQRRIRVYSGIAVVLGLVLTFFVGQITGRQGELTAEQENGQLHTQVKELRKNLQDARDQLAVHRTQTAVAEQAQAQVQQRIKSLQDQVAELEEAVAFYKNVMSPGSDDRGLHIEKLDLSPGDKNGTYNYRLVLTQRGDNRAYLSGQVQLVITGMQGDKQVSLNHVPLEDGSETSFHFRYFQELDGTLKMPEGFTPRQVKVRAVASGRRSDHDERDFTWQLQEKTSARAG